MECRLTVSYSGEINLGKESWLDSYLGRGWYRSRAVQSQEGWLNQLEYKVGMPTPEMLDRIKAAGFDVVVVPPIGSIKEDSDEVEVGSVSGEIPAKTIIVVEYPFGTSMLDGVETDNGVIAAKILGILESSDHSVAGMVVPKGLGGAGESLASVWKFFVEEGWSAYKLCPDSDGGACWIKTEKR